MLTLSTPARWFIGLSLIGLPTIESGGYFLIGLLQGEYQAQGFSEMQRALFRAGHAHAGVLTLLSIIGQLLADAVRLSVVLTFAARVGLLLGAGLVSMGMFAAAGPPGASAMSGLAVLIHAGAVALGLSTILLGVGVIRGRAAPIQP